MEIKEIKTPNDILEYMKEHIKYGWLDINNEEHVGNMQNFRRLYRISSMEETITHGLGTCIEQVYLMHTLLDSLGIKNKMFCTRVYEKDDFNDLDQDEHMHCFVLYYQDDKVYQIEHPNWERVGIHEFESEAAAMNDIKDYYEKRANGVSRAVTEFFEVEPGLSFQQFNAYINGLDRSKEK